MARAFCGDGSVCTCVTCGSWNSRRRKAVIMEPSPQSLTVYDWMKPTGSPPWQAMHAWAVDWPSMTGRYSASMSCNDWG
jgi:hypothetical protein